MRLGCRDEILNIEQAMYATGLLENELMERAGKHASDWIIKNLFANSEAAFSEKLNKNKIKRVLILIGPGNNGGDALVVARCLKSHFLKFYKFKIICFSSNQKQDQDLNIKTFDDFFNETILDTDLIVDGVFGIGLNRPVAGIYAEVIKKINGSVAKIISLDCPSGLDVNTGRVLGLSVKTHWTLSFGLSKPGFYLLNGPECCGKIILIDIGFSKQLKQRFANSCFLFGKTWAQRVLPKRIETAYKSHGGKCLVLGGSFGMWGAGILAAKASARVGAGYVYLANQVIFPGFKINQKISSAFVENPDFLTISNQPEKLDEKFQEEKFNSVVIGPGLGVNEKSYAQLKKIIELSQKYRFPVVLDADGINLVGKKKISELPENWVLTPHAGELSKLMGISIKEIDNNRLLIVREASQRFGCLILLKGFHTLVGVGNRSVIINSGNKALAKAGTGDVLSGMIGGFMSQGLSTLNASCLGAYVHGFIADEWVRQGKDYLSLMASDLINFIPSILSKVREGKTIYL